MTALPDAPPPSACSPQTRPPTAILATSDVLALGVLDAAAAAGIRVPRDLSLSRFAVGRTPSPAV